MFSFYLDVSFVARYAFMAERLLMETVMDLHLLPLLVTLDHRLQHTPSYKTKLPPIGCSSVTGASFAVTSTAASLHLATFVSIIGSLSCFMINRLFIYLDTVCPDGNDFLSVEVTREIADRVVYTLQTLKNYTKCDRAPVETSHGRQLFNRKDPRRPKLAYMQSLMEQSVLDSVPSIDLKILDVSSIRRSS